MSKTKKSSTRKRKPHVAIPASIEERTIAALSKLSEAQLTWRIIMPLLRAIQPEARVEETHGSNEAGRDLIWFLNHSILTRTSTICIQVKSHRISTGSTTGPYSLISIVNQMQSAKITGVYMPDGTKIFPDEVWVMNSHPFSEPQRRVTQDILAQARSFGGKLIDGIELVGLIMKKHPDLAADLIRLGSPQLMQIIAGLSAHRESRAFGLRIDRASEEFHIAARACPTTSLTSMLMSGRLKSTGPSIAYVEWATSGQEAATLTFSGCRIDPQDLPRSSSLRDIQPFEDKFDIPCNYQTSIKREPQILLTRTYFVVDCGEHIRQRILKCLDSRLQFEVRTITPAGETAGDFTSSGTGLVSEDATRSAWADKLTHLPDVVLNSGLRWQASLQDLDENHDHCVVSRAYTFDFGEAAERARTALEHSFSTIPASLADAPEQVAQVVRQVAATERFLAKCVSLDVLRIVSPERYFKIPDIAIPNELQLLDVDTTLLIEGPPGSGKTTLLRRLAVQLITAGKHALFIPCSNLRMEHQDLAFEDIAKRVAFEGTPKEWSIQDSILLIDGLDESPFDISDMILEAAEVAPAVVATNRLAFESIVRTRFRRLEVVPFSDADRDAFFEHWFRLDATRRDLALRLVREHPDIGHHTKTPLVATVLAALLEKDYIPKTRNAVYNSRLDLLLGQWDYSRGVQRKHIATELTKRFLEHLAFHVHSMPERRSSFGPDEIRHTFAESLGRGSRGIVIDQLIEDLVVGAGVLVRDRDVFSFGHLTFQEHLAGRYLKRNLNIRRVVPLLGDSWWKEALLFYAGEKEDITDFIELCERQVGFASTHAEQLMEMIKSAPYTQEVVEQILLQARQTMRKRA